MSIDDFIKEMDLKKCRYCEHLNECNYCDDLFSSCEDFELESDLTDMVEFYNNYK